MRKTYLPFVLFAISLVSCSGTAGLTGEKLYRVITMGGDHIVIYSDGTTDHISFNNGVFITTTYGSKENDWSNISGKRTLRTVGNGYFNASSNLIYVNANATWYNVYNYQTREECTDKSNYHLYTKPTKPTSDFFLWGEYGDGWVKNCSSNGSFALFVTEKYAKKVGIRTITYAYNNETDTYVSSGGNYYY